MLSASHFIDGLAARGRHHFTTDEAVAALGVSLPAARAALRRLKAKGEVFALSTLMLRLMAESASVGVHTHGGAAWKAFGGALLRLSEASR